MNKELIKSVLMKKAELAINNIIDQIENPDNHYKFKYKHTNDLDFTIDITTLNDNIPSYRIRSHIRKFYIKGD